MSDEYIFAYDAE